MSELKRLAERARVTDLAYAWSPLVGHLGISHGRPVIAARRRARLERRWNRPGAYKLRGAGYTRKRRKGRAA